MTKVGFIYKIEHIDGSGLCYVGSTSKTLEERLKTHKSKSTQDINNLFYIWVDYFGWDKFEIHELEKVKYDDIRELRKKEDEWIVRIKPQLNSIRSHTTIERKKEIQRYHDKLRYSDPKRIEYKKKYAKEYYSRNVDRINEKRRVYFQSIKTKVYESRKNDEFRKKSREYQATLRAEKYHCGCGSIIGMPERYKHFKSKKHNKWLTESESE